MYFPVLRHKLFASFPFFVIDIKSNKQVEVLCCIAFYNVSVMRLNSMLREEQNKKYRITTWLCLLFFSGDILHTLCQLYLFISNSPSEGLINDKFHALVHIQR